MHVSGCVSECTVHESDQSETSEGSSRPGRCDAEHILPCEAGGITMLELVEAMKADASAQEKLIAIFSGMLDATVERNDMLQRRTTLLSFEGNKPAISASAYVKRIIKYSHVSSCCFVVAMIYLERLKRREPSVCLTSQTFQRILLVAVMEAAKFLDDYYDSNKHWAQIGGMSTLEVNGLELEFLFRIGFDLFVTRDEYDWYASHLLAQERIAKEQPSTPDMAEQTEDEAAPSGKTMEDIGKVPSYSDVTDASKRFFAVSDGADEMSD